MLNNPLQQHTFISVLCYLAVFLTKVYQHWALQLEFNGAFPECFLDPKSLSRDDLASFIIFLTLETFQKVTL
jgi:hypothetical protein